MFVSGDLSMIALLEQTIESEGQSLEDAYNPLFGTLDDFLRQHGLPKRPSTVSVQQLQQKEDA